MSHKPKILVVCVLAIVVMIALVVFADSRRNANAIAEARHAQRVKGSRRNFAKDLVRMKMMSPYETAKFQEVTTEVLQNHAISDSDLDWMLALLNKPENEPGNTIQIHYIDLGALDYVRTTTPQQKDKVFNATLPLLTSTEPLDKTSADMALAAFKVTKAIPYIQSQLQDSNPSVRKFAKYALAKLVS